MAYSTPGLYSSRGGFKSAEATVAYFKGEPTGGVHSDDDVHVALDAYNSLQSQLWDEHNHSLCAPKHRPSVVPAPLLASRGELEGRPRQ